MKDMILRVGLGLLLIGMSIQKDKIKTSQLHGQTLHHINSSNKEQFFEENKYHHLLQVDLEEKEKLKNILGKLENLFVYYSIDEAGGLGMKSSILVDRNGQRKELEVNYENATELILKETNNILHDTVQRIDQASFQFSLQSSFLKKKLAVVLFQNTEPRNTLIGYRSIAA
jgi:hypothetical protein